MRAAAGQHRWRDVPRSVIALGFVSLFMDLSSELVHSLLPLFLTVSLGTSMLAVGLIEGVAEATAAVAKLFSGVISDRIGQRKWLAVAGYGLSALTKPLFPLSASVGTVFAARFLDRVGKGVRGAPRDALVADITPPALRGRAFGLRQSLDTVGAFAGPLAAMALMVLYADDFRAVMWWAVLPAAIAVALLVFGVQEPLGNTPSGASGWPIRRAVLTQLPRGYWAVVGVGTIFTLARFSEAFLVIKGHDAGLALALVPLVMVAMNLVYALVAAPAGALSDRIGRARLLAGGMVVLIAADGVLALTTGLIGLFAGVGLWGLHMALTQGLLAAMIADTAPDALRGTAFGLFNLVTGLALLLASALAGVIWARFGAPATFAAGAGLALLSLLALGVASVLQRRRGFG